MNQHDLNNERAVELLELETLAIRLVSKLEIVLTTPHTLRSDDEIRSLIEEAKEKLF